MKRFENMARNFFGLDQDEKEVLIEDYMVEVTNNPSLEDEKDMAYYFFEYADEYYSSMEYSESVEEEYDDYEIVQDYLVAPKVNLLSSPKKSKSKKDELIESLAYLKSKKNKTKQDRESIYTLEMVLKNMK